MVRMATGIAAFVGAFVLALSPLSAQDKQSPQAAAPAPVKLMPDEQPKAPGSENWLQQAAKAVEIHGFVDVGWGYNLNRPATRLNGNTGDSGLYDAFGNEIPGGLPAYDGSSIRAFDQRSNSFTMHNAQLMLAKDATAESRVGFLLELSAGSDAEVIDATGDTDPDNFDVQEANITYLAPLGGKDLKVTAGKFATRSGYEVIESMNNFNYSRSLPFLFAIPFTHVGVRATYPIADTFTATLGFNNGWDNTEDVNNDAKTLELQVAGSVNCITAALTIYYGSERRDTPGVIDSPGSGGKRSLIDLVVTASKIPGLDNVTLGFNLDIGEEEDAIVSISGLDDDASWMGWALYAKYEMDEYVNPALRISTLTDTDAYRTGVDQKLMEFTLTNEIKAVKDVILRVEYRYDKSDENVFLDHSKKDDIQHTIGFEAIYKF